MKICIIGSGYVGLVSGACFSEMGNNVICVDQDQDKISMLSQGKVPIYEPGLGELIERNHKEGRLRFTSDLEEGISGALLCFICVGTPQDTDGSADLSSVLDVASQIGKIIKEYKIIVDKSTVPVKTAQKVRQRIQKGIDDRGLSNLEFDIVSNPEFLKEGNAIQDFMRPERVIIGTDNVRTAEILKELYNPYLRTSNNPVLVMDIRSAELTKYASNAFLATKITFMNELSILCEKIGADITHVRKGMGVDERIGSRFLLAGPGYGGSCFPKDVRALIATANEYDLDLKICIATSQANQRQRIYAAQKVIEYYKDSKISEPYIAVWGLTFKPKTDDVRESPALDIIEAMLNKDMKVRAFDPQGMENTRETLGDRIEYAQDSYDALRHAHGLVIVTEWNMFKSPDLERIKKLMARPVIFDFRNILYPEEVRSAGITYFGLGRS
ncbi:MAG: UDP-glucose/GDP-mannose dehydrogenase family protein [Thermodesulfobacteriota bacterium]|nr:UDP-glucose/GDP-mannose dehydrogenase family protein [Thermodesulfobacteriota bacterium]